MTECVTPATLRLLRLLKHKSRHPSHQARVLDAQAPPLKLIHQGRLGFSCALQQYYLSSLFLHLYHPTSPPVSPYLTTCITLPHHLYHLTSPPLSPYFTTCITLPHHLYHLTSPPVSPYLTTCITLPHHLYHLTSPPLSPYLTTCTTPFLAHKT